MATAIESGNPWLPIRGLAPAGMSLGCIECRFKDEPLFQDPTVEAQHTVKTLWPGKRSIGCGWNALLSMSLFATPLAVQAGEAPVFLSTAEVAGERLQLSGSGSRYKSMFRVFDAALYAHSPVSSMQGLNALSGAKRLRLVAVRDIRAAELVHLLLSAAIGQTNGDRAPARSADMAQIASRLGAPLQVKRGDSLDFDFVPGRGVQLLFNGDPLGPPLADPGLFQRLLGPWVGPQAADAALMRALLGGSRASAQSPATAHR